MSIQRNSPLDPKNVGSPIDQIYKKINAGLDRARQARIDSVKEIAQHKLSEILTPEAFAKKYDWEQRDQILKDQFSNRVSSSELKPYLLADREYLVKHFRNRDLIEAFEGQSRVPDGIPNDYYFDYEEIEKTLRFPIQGISSDEVAAVMGEINPEIIGKIRTLDFFDCYNMVDLSALKKFAFGHLHELNCGGMSNLETLSGLPHCHYREINLKNCGNLKELDQLEGISIKKLNLEFCGNLRDLTPLLKIKDLEIINIQFCTRAKPTPENVEALETLKSRGVKIHCQQVMIPWRKFRHLFESTPQLGVSSHLKV